MPVRTYEAMFLLDSNKAAANWEETVESVHKILEKYQAEIVASRQWDERRLAYPIRYNNVTHRKGTYLLTYFRADVENLVEIGNDFKLNETIIRELIVRIPPQLEESLISQAMAYNPADEIDERDERRERERERDERRDRERERGDRGGRRRDRDGAPPRDRSAEPAEEPTQRVSEEVPAETESTN